MLNVFTNFASVWVFIKANKLFKKYEEWAYVLSGHNNLVCVLFLTLCQSGVVLLSLRCILQQRLN